MSGAQEPHQVHIMVGDRNMEMGDYILRTKVLWVGLGAGNCGIAPEGDKRVIHSNKRAGEKTGRLNLYKLRSRGWGKKKWG